MSYNNPPATCDFCKAKINRVFIDGKTIYGPWAFMCPPCHSKNGVGLGTGRGQRYVKTGDDFVKQEG